MESKNRRRALRGASALVAGALLALGFAGAASAAGPATIDSSKTGTLTIHKYEQPASSLGLDNDGTEQSVPSSAKPLAGVTFKAERLTDYDLTTNEGWQALSGLTVADAQSAPKDAPVTAGPTGSDGLAVFSGLPLGVYLVTETDYPNGTTPAAPFLVTLPLTDPANHDNWLYNVHVYPKNSTLNEPTKTVDEGESIAVGQDITWTIQGDIPRTNQDADGKDIPLSGYRVTDQLDSKLTYKSLTVSLVSESGGAGATVTLAKDTDYTIDSTNPVQVTLTTAGLAKAAAFKKAHDADAKVQVDIVTTVNEVGDIKNKALVFSNEDSFTAQPGDPNYPQTTNEVDSKWGNVTIEKVEAGSATVKVSGAEFRVFASEADAKNQTNPITVDGVSTWTTDDNGKLTISGLRYSGYYQGATIGSTDPNYQTYWIVETKSANGYSLLAAPVEVVVDDEDTVVDYKLTADAKHNGGFDLPFTGSALSASLFYGGGAAVLLAIAVTLVARSRRKNNVEA